MENKLPTLILTYLVFLSAFLMAPSIGMSQSAGDVAFTAYNADGPGDGFAVVLFVDYAVGDEIHFSSQEWDGSSFSGSGGDFTWVAPTGGTSAGTVLVFSNVEGTPSVNMGSIINDANMNLSGSGDVIYAYTGVDKNTPDTPFLGAVATASDEYNGPEGTLTNTGLTQGSTAILLSENIDIAEYIGNRSGNTPNGYRTELNLINGETATDDNWEQVNGSGDQSGQIQPFDDTNFVLVNPPTVAFTAADATVAEDGGSTTLTVELVEANGTAVSVDVAFLGSSSAADLSDIDNYSTKTVSFTSSDPSGATRNVTVTLTDDSNFEGDEIAVFQLQNNTNGAIIHPEELSLTIADNDAPDIVINEILYDPAGDANGDGTISTSDDEFVELVNNSSSDLDISNWTLSDGAGVKYTFPAGTVIPANSAFVVFADPAEGTNFGGAYLFSAGSLGLNNGGDDVILMDADNNTIANVTYSGSVNDESITRNPDLTGSFEAHTTADSGNDSSPFSPGTQVDDTPFGSAYAIGIRGNEGWRFVATPTQSTTFDDLFADFWTQGITGSDAPAGAVNLYNWQESSGGTFGAVGDMANTMEPGRGYIIYVYEDDDFRTAGIQGGFPKVVNTNNAENSGPVSVAVSASDDDGSGSIDNNEGYNLLGNPYGTDVSVTAILDALEAVDPSVNMNISVWDDDAGSGNGAYVDLSDGDQLAPFQAFFVRYTAAGVSGNVSFDRSNLAANSGTQFYGQPNDSETVMNFEIYLGDGDKFDTYEVEFSPNGTIGEDRYDAYKLFSLNANSINFFSTVGDDVRLAKNVLPSIKSLEEGEELRVPFGYDIPQSGDYIFSWILPDQLPEDFELYLVDRETGQQVDMRTREEYPVTLAQGDGNQQGDTQNKPSPALNKAKASENTGRFELKVVKSEQVQAEPEPMQKPVVLSPNYPNPFNNQTRMDLDLEERMHVKVTIWNIVGQKVATMKDEMMDAGQDHPLVWNAPANMPSGIYICKVEAGGTVITRKMTLVK